MKATPKWNALREVLMVLKKIWNSKTNILKGILSTEQHLFLIQKTLFSIK